MPALEVANAAPEEPGPINPVVGIIYPPPEVRNIVDKTSSFVARNGPEFEARLRQNESENPKFNFLNPGDPYHAYYQHKVNDFREGKGQEPASNLLAAISKLTATAAAQQKQQEISKQVEQPFVPKDPPSEFEFTADPPSISALDLDIMKLTAQFVARNGPQFLTQLMNREQRNFQFDFLRPQHSLFPYFTKLLEQYTKPVKTPVSSVMPTQTQTITWSVQQPMSAPPMAQMRPPPLMMAAPPPMAGFVTPMPPQMGPPMGMPVKRPSEILPEEEPSNKKMRNEDSLIPEEVFLSRNPHPVAIKIAIPMQPEKTEWKLTGQTMTLNVPLSKSVSSIKSKIQEETNMPPAKQKLFYDGMFFKDSNTLAYYNIITGAVIQVQVKERGGRKK